jgi:hypothetical protein
MRDPGGSKLKRKDFTKNLVQVKLWLPKTIHTKVKRFRRRTGQSMSLVTETALRQYLKENA